MGSNSSLYGSSTFGTGLASNTNLSGNPTFGNGVADNATFLANILVDTNLNAKWGTYDVALFKSGKVSAVSDEITRFVSVRTFSIPNNFTGSYARSRTIASGASAVFGIYRSGSRIGTVTFSSGSTIGSIANYSGSGPFSFSAGTILTIVALTANSNQEDISIVLKGSVS